MDHGCREVQRVFAAGQSASAVEFAEDREQEKLLVVMQTLTVVGKDTLDKLIELLRLSQVQPGYFEAVLDLKVGIPDPLRNHAALGNHILNVLLIVGQVQTWAHDSAGQLAMLRPQHP